ncbi:HAMP domain-containing sensor histidine kinase [Streptomyces sp. ME19-01-6]|uniref:sensor histidine kinase n=1 Tax=Streptomyces sp. ME19-01-6 TaxID=3028686 RepID=UPI0029A42A22|nr:HAMP domain-containing sensor histidine kinase [Streptomyces sp. ME19-01-6]MDX3224447.1 HAMP domain-containing sensor histidine kinase [Streptomyces sp. ME19-01-6]
MSPLTGMSVRAKATSAAVGTVTLAIALCMLALVLVMRQNLRDSAEADAKHTAVSVAAQLTKSGKMWQADKAVVVTPPSVVAAQLTKSGKMWQADKAVVVTPPSVTIKEATGQAIGRPAKAPWRGTFDSQAPTVLSVGNHTPYSVDVAPSTTALDNATRLLLRQVAPAAAGLVLFVAALTWLLVGRALRPVAAIREEFTEITERDLHRRVPVPKARDEISRLARTMNATLDRLHQAMTRQRQFVADASHELRSPIAAVRTQLELALARPSRTDWPTAAHKALQDTERLQAVASDLLLLARLDAQEAPPRSPVDLAALAAEEVRLHPGTVVACADASGEDAGQAAAAVVHGSRVQLSRLLTNLTDNARRHARTTVSIGVAVRDGRVELSVDDDGPGIPEPDRERVFERFTRLDDARARQDGGTGLGLAIAKDIAHAHGGTLTLHTSPRGGARVLLRLPCQMRL